ncbi:Ribosomal protein S18 acetylase RimI [Actinoplanes regularis]|uniref:Ribosomal protein S18 acetylase RimI n=1 Tax=Actinoplanes regularis TaxID=52697 RepID=A0A239EUZ1_9ACTN|nr:GNAT family N-acetyltransferase [Actinoplanes regularis]SNS48486.1 Ribosomal protein S18 acetylase RimI [Actinoplanes regularis]
MYDLCSQVAADGPYRSRVIELLDGSDPELLATVTDLVNLVYRESERGLWQDGATRTSLAEVTTLARAGELAADLRDGRLAGVVRVQRMPDRVGEFGMLAADPARRGEGIGGGLIRWAEEHCRGRGDRTMRLELLVPRGWRLESKELLHAWYSRLGYRIERIGHLEEQYPQLAPLLAGPAEYRVYTRTL